MIFILRYWKYIAIILVVLSGYLYVTHIIHENRTLKTELHQALEAYQTCQKIHEQERTVSDEYQTKAASLRNQLRNALRVRKCVPVSMPTPPARSGTTPSARELSSGNGLDSGYLVDFAGRCEETRIKLIGCQELCKNKASGH